MRNKRLATNVKVVRCMAPAVVGTGVVTAVEVNCTGYKRVMYVFNMGACGSTASTLALKFQEAAVTGGGGAWADITSAASAGLTKATHQNKVCVYDIPVNPDKLFQQLVGTVGTDTWAMSGIAILYNADYTLSYPFSTAYATEIVTV